MNSLILLAFSRLFFVGMILASLFVLYRGHNEPGGGFVGGLMAAAAFAILALGGGSDRARRALRIHPATVMGVGVALAILSGLPGLFTDNSYLKHWWLHIGDLHTGTALLFDIGVYLVVLSGVLALVLRFYEEDE